MMMQETAGQSGKTVTHYSNRKFPSVPQLTGKQNQKPWACSRNTHDTSSLWCLTGLSLGQKDKEDKQAV